MNRVQQPRTLLVLGLNAGMSTHEHRHEANHIRLLLATRKHAPEPLIRDAPALLHQKHQLRQARRPGCPRGYGAPCPLPTPARHPLLELPNRLPKFWLLSHAARLAEARGLAEARVLELPEALLEDGAVVRVAESAPVLHVLARRRGGALSRPISPAVADPLVGAFLHLPTGAFLENLPTAH